MGRIVKGPAYNLQLRPEAPSGLQDDPIQLPPVSFGSTPGAEIILPMPTYELTEEGLY